MRANPYSTPDSPSENSDVILRQTKPNRRRVFAAISFVAAWLTFYLAYSFVILTPGYPDDITINWYTAWIWESLTVAAVVCILACASLFFVRCVNSGNYVFLALICAFEFISMFLFFAAFFGI
jgi:hypothetical protein